MQPTRLSAPSALAAACAGAAAWCSAGTMALTDAGPRASRIGVLPSAWWLAAAMAAAIAAAWWWRVSADRARPLFFSAALIVPWVPVSLPPAALIWTGPITWIVWAAIAGAVLASGSPGGAIAARSRPWLGDPRRAPWAAFVCAALLYTATAHQLSALVPGGDEPHYLVIAQSLWRDGDLRIENNHQRGDYLEYFKGSLRPDYLKRGQDGQIYSIHLPGVPALIAPLLALGGYRLVNLGLALASAAATAVVWRMTFALVGSAAASWFAFASVALTAPFLFLSFTVYPDGPAAIVVLMSFGAVVALSKQPDRPARWWMGAGLLLALLPWFHPRFAVIAAALGAVLGVRALGGPRRATSLVAFAAAPLLSAAGWFAYYAIIYGRPDPSIAYGHYTQMSVGRVPIGVLGLLADQQYGLLVNAPVYAIALLGIVPLLRRHTRLAVEWLAVIVPYTAVTAMYHMWWGGLSSPARFIGATFLVFSVPLAVAWAATRDAATRAAQAALLAMSLALAAVFALAEGGQFAFNVREPVAPWLVWMSEVSDVARAVPGMFRSTSWDAFVQTGVWTAAICATWVIARQGARVLRLQRGAAALVVLVMGGLAATTSVAIAWRLEGVAGTVATVGQLRALEAVGRGRVMTALTYDPVAFTTPGPAIERLRLGVERVAGAPGGNWLWIPHVPAGRYRIWIDNQVAGAGFDAAVFVGRTDAPLDRWQTDSLPLGASSRELWLPVAVHSVAIRGSEAARRNLRAIWLQPAEGSGVLSPLTSDRAAAAIRYGDTSVFNVG
ncbi:MAG: hypothetical protein NTY02_17820, partial [Acidobacteria bacterium]|nr:hypothetical protein [Acidobacteriota bacterium]